MTSQTIDILHEPVCLTMQATPDAVLEAEAETLRVARELHLDVRTAGLLARAVGELVLNACTYAYRSEAGVVTTEFSYHDGLLDITVSDAGSGFNCNEFFRPDGTPGPKAQPKMGLMRAARAADRISVASGRFGTTIRMVKRIRNDEQ